MEKANAGGEKAAEPCQPAQHGDSSDAEGAGGSLWSQQEQKMDPSHKAELGRLESFKKAFAIHFSNPRTGSTPPSSPKPLPDSSPPRISGFHLEQIKNNSCEHCCIQALNIQNTAVTYHGFFTIKKHPIERQRSIRL